jgi:2,4-dienoyl-CoA reductase-like NADH-dependent reductase (Old Yellow Enzyme family)
MNTTAPFDTQIQTHTMSALETLSAPLKLACGLELPNRLVKVGHGELCVLCPSTWLTRLSMQAPMAESTASKSERYMPEDKHFSAYRIWGEGKWGMLITGSLPSRIFA